MYFNSHGVHASQFEGQFKIFSETRCNFRSKYHQNKKSGIFGENPNIPSEHILYKCLKNILK